MNISKLRDLSIKSKDEMVVGSFVSLKVNFTVGLVSRRDHLVPICVGKSATAEYAAVPVRTEYAHVS